MTVHIDELVQLSNKSAKFGGGISWRTIVDQLNKLSSDEIQLLTFDSIEDVREFYLCHSKMVGFGIRERDEKKDQKGIVTYKWWVCNREGFRNSKWLNLVNRKKEAKRLMRVGCLATIIVQWNKDI
ncbi:uncharacterized protein LOC113776724 [Coffea eugenioides]|uniref:uncharacterized protein LOC113776724 n=1 Tax=Coffea eugenioides TaxID=49369 RepID=UPI000F60A1E1|nr:uncharacterized protein LOC113776724 [Coffea eugenioides]